MPDRPNPDRALPSRDTPTNVRFLVVALAIAMSVLLYLDRFAITAATDTMLGELSLSKTQFGEAVGAFFLAYALMQIPSGWLTDTLGARWMLALFVGCWSLATLGLGLAEGLAAIWVMRLVLGVAQAGAYPAAAGLLKRWIPYGSRGLANSSVAMGGRCGLLLSLAVTVPLMLLVGDWRGSDVGNWRYVFAFYGSLGLIWSIAFLWLYRERPSVHPWCNAAEAELIAPEPSAIADAPQGVVDVLASSAPEGEAGRQILKPGVPTATNPYESPKSGPGNAATQANSIGSYCAFLFVANLGWILLVSLLPGFLLQHHGDELAQTLGLTGRKVFLTAVPIVAGLFGTLALCTLVNALVAGVAHPAARRLQLPLTAMLVSKEVWLMCLISFAVNIGWIFLATWLPQYLIETHGSTLRAIIGNGAAVAGVITAVVQLAAMFGGVAGGMATDVFVRRFGPVWGRRLPGVLSGLLVCGMYLCVPALPGMWSFVAAMIAIAFTIDFGLGAIWASYQDIGGEHVASVLGVGNMCGNLGAACFGLFIGYLADNDQWNHVFLISAVAMLVVTAGWLLFDATRPVVRAK